MKINAKMLLELNLANSNYLRLFNELDKAGQVGISEFKTDGLFSPVLTELKWTRKYIKKILEKLEETGIFMEIKVE
ncbi:MAG: hypothetical protein FWC41_09590 [Firmicutes bacterium]|nr:hypothetical protein [Bacillota bacterium]